MIRTRVQYFYDASKPIHCKLKNGKWYNGYIREVSADFFLINELKLGELPIFFIQLEEVTAYIPK